MTLCSSCDSSLMGKRYVLRDDKPTCLTCYEKKFANSCHTCKNPIGTESKDVTYKGNHFHENCFLCASCHSSLANVQFLTQGTSLICETCYDRNYATICDGCTKKFNHGNQQVEYNGKKYHTECFKCMSCKKPIGDNTFMPYDNDFMCMNCHNAQTGTNCGGCSKRITKVAIKFDGRSYHKECFVCRACKTSLAGVKFATKDGMPFCPACYVKKFSRRCEFCAQPISGLGTTAKFVSYEGKQWHSVCFCCSVCTRNLAGEGFLLKDSKIMCGKCGC